MDHVEPPVEADNTAANVPTVISQLSALIALQHQQFDSADSKAISLLTTSLAIAGVYLAQLPSRIEPWQWFAAVSVVALFGVSAALAMDIYLPRAFRFGMNPQSMLNELHKPGIDLQWAVDLAAAAEKNRLDLRQKTRRLKPLLYTVLMQAAFAAVAAMLGFKF